MRRRIIQITVAGNGLNRLYALANDGTLWELITSDNVKRWKEIDTDLGSINHQKDEQ